MKDGIGEGYTREDHPDISNQLFSAYSKVQDIRALAQIVGEDDLSDRDKRYMKFGDAFEANFVTQSYNENRDIDNTLDLSWKILSLLSQEELDRLKPDLMEKYMKLGD